MDGGDDPRAPETGTAASWGLLAADDAFASPKDNNRCQKQVISCPVLACRPGALPLDTDVTIVILSLTVHIRASPMMRCA